METLNKSYKNTIGLIKKISKKKPFDPLEKKSWRKEQKM